VSTATYTRYELLRTFRNRRFFVFSLIFPLILFFAVAAPNRKAHIIGIGFPLYFMTGMTAWGTMAAVAAGGARIAAERSVGWTRQMRITPLPARAYFRAKILSGYLMASVSIVLLYAAGTSLGVRLSATQWLTMTGLVLVGLIPFCIFGILIGHLLTVESLGPALGGGTSLFALLGGAYGPIATGGVLHEIVEGLPSYWLVQAGKSALRHGGWPPEGWIVIAVWSIVLLRLTFLVYRRDTQRV
jgi:ABC-2 type transport system permease protein